MTLLNILKPGLQNALFIQLFGSSYISKSESLPASLVHNVKFYSVGPLAMCC
jgi:hypothetical protein